MLQLVVVILCGFFFGVLTGAFFTKIGDKGMASFMCIVMFVVMCFCYPGGSSSFMVAKISLFGICFALGASHYIGAKSAGVLLIVGAVAVFLRHGSDDVSAYVLMVAGVFALLQVKEVAPGGE